MLVDSFKINGHISKVSQVNGRASPHRVFLRYPRDKPFASCCSDGGGQLVFSLALRSIHADPDGDFVVTVEDVDWDCVHMVHETSAALLDCCTVEKTGMIRDRDKSCPTVKRLNTYLAAVCKQVCGQAVLQS